MSLALALPRLISARACFCEIPASPAAYPLEYPECSTSQAAETLRWHRFVSAPRGSWESRVSRGGARAQICELLLAEPGILKERSSAVAIGISGDDQHAFASPYCPHRIAHFGESWRRLASGEMFFQIGVSQTRSAARFNR